MKLSDKLWCDLKTDSEKHAWLLMGMGVSTGVVCHAIQTDLANSYHVKMQVEKERDNLRELCGELLEEMRIIKMTVISPLDAYFIASEAITKAEKALGGNDGI